MNANLKASIENVLFELYEIHSCENKPYFQNHYTSQLITVIGWLHKLNFEMNDEEFYQYFLGQETRIKKAFFYDTYPGDIGDRYWKLMTIFVDKTLRIAKSKNVKS